jgi:hypothetical protein
MAGITKLSGERIVLSNADYLIVTPYSSESEIGTTSYDIVDIVGDTLSFTPDDNNINAKEWEFGDTPLFENVTLGKIQFAATCVDFRNEMMQEIFGWVKGSNTDTMYAPNGYKDLYAVVEVGFKNEGIAVVVPKLKLNSKAVISSLKTGTGESQLAGTAYIAEMSVGTDSVVKTPMAFVSRGTEADGAYPETEYTIVNGSKKAKFKTGNATTSGLVSNNAAS